MSVMFTFSCVINNFIRVHFKMAEMRIKMNLNLKVLYTAPGVSKIRRRGHSRDSSSAHRTALDFKFFDF